MGLESAETTLTNPGPCASEGVCSDTEDASEVEAECEASGVLRGEEGYARMDGLGMTRASLGTRTCVGLESAKTTLTNPGPCTSEGACSDTEDAGEVEAECEASGVSGGRGADLGWPVHPWAPERGGQGGVCRNQRTRHRRTRDDQSILGHRNVGYEELELALLELWCVNGAGTG